MNHEHSAALCAALEQSDLLLGLFDAQDNLQLANAAYRAEFLRDAPLPMPFGDVLRLGFAGQFGVKVDSGDIEAFLADILPRRRSSPSRSFATDTVGGRWLQFSETLLPDGWLLTIATDISTLEQHERIIVWCQRMPPAKSTCRSKILQTQDFLRPVITDSNTKDASVTTRICKEIDIFSISRPTLKACVQAWSLLRPLLCCDIKQH